MKLIPDMPDAEYFSGTHYGIHSIMDIDKYGPRGFWDRHIDKNVVQFGGSRAFNVGTAAHEFILRGESAFLARCTKQPSHYKHIKKFTKKELKSMEDKVGGYPGHVKYDDEGDFFYEAEWKPWNNNAAACKQWNAENRKIVLKEEEYHSVYMMAESVHEHPIAAEYFELGYPEVGVRTKFGTVPVQCKCDWLHGTLEDPETIVDLKTCASLDDFHKHFHKYGYWRQAAHYQRVVFKTIGKLLPFVFIAVEKESPYRTELFEIDEDYLAEANEANKSSYNLIEGLLMSNGARKPWPKTMTEHKINTIHCPSWLGEH